MQAMLVFNSISFFVDDSDKYKSREKDNYIDGCSDGGNIKVHKIRTKANI